MRKLWNWLYYGKWTDCAHTHWFRLDRQRMQCGACDAVHVYYRRVT